MNEVTGNSEAKTKKKWKYRGGLFWPVVLIAIGVLFLLNNLSVLTGDVGSTLLKLWPLLLILVGLDSLLKGHGLAGPIFLIGLGVAFLLGNFGSISWNAWELILRLWPVFIIALGLDIMLGRRSVWGSLLALFLMIAIVAGALWLMNIGSTVDPQTFRWEPTASVSRIDATLSPAVGTLQVASLSGGNALAEGSLYLRRSQDANSQMLSNGTFSIRSDTGMVLSPFGQGSRWKWEVYFTPSLPIDMKVNMGVGVVDLNLSELDITRMSASNGVGVMKIVLPDKAFNGKVENGIGETVIILPRNVEARIKLDTGITAVNMPSGFTHTGDIYTSPGYNNSGSTRIDLEINLAIGNLRVEYAK